MSINRNISVDTLRGIACILLVAYHVIGSNNNHGLKVSDGVYRDLNDILAFIRMPLFTFLSGLVYANRPFVHNSKKFIIGKVKRLLIPMITVGSIFAIVQSFIPGSNQAVQNWHLLHIIPVGHFWFLEAIFLIFMLIVPLEKFQLLSSKISFTLVFFVTCLFYVSNLELRYFSISGFIYLLPFFLAGLATQRFNLSLIISKKIVGLILIILACILITIYIGLIHIKSNRTPLALFIGCLSCYSLFSLKFNSHALAKIGIYSYSIYLFHVFFTAGSRIFLSKLGVTDINILFSLSLFAGVLGPIFFEEVFNKHKLTRLLFLGKSR